MTCIKNFDKVITQLNRVIKEEVFTDDYFEGRARREQAKASYAQELIKRGADREWIDKVKRADADDIFDGQKSYIWEQHLFKIRQQFDDSL
jgi:SOS response regulatory protein OraA/RecX